MVSKEMAIPLLSHLGWTLCFFSSWVFFRATAHVLLYALLFYFHFVRLLFGFRWHRGVPSLYGLCLGPQDYSTLLFCVTCPLISLNN